MSEENKEIELIRELIRATEEGRIAWHPTARVDEFTASFQGHLSVLVSKAEAERCHLRIVDEDDRELLYVSDDSLYHRAPFDPIRTQMELMTKSLMGPSPGLVCRLFDLARRSGLKVDQAIDQILQGLKSA